MSKDMEQAQKEMLAARVVKEREMFRDMIAITALGGIISGMGFTSSRTEQCKEAYAYADEMLKVRDLRS